MMLAQGSWEFARRRRRYACAWRQLRVHSWLSETLCYLGLAVALAAIASSAHALTDDFVEQQRMTSKAWVVQSGLRIIGGAEERPTCQLSTMSPDGAWFTHATDGKAAHVLMRFDDPPTNIEKGAHWLTITIDNSPPLSLTGKFSGRVIEMSWPDQPDLFALMTKGQRMVVSLDRASFIFALDGTAQAVSWYRDCKAMLVALMKQS